MPALIPVQLYEDGELIPGWINPNQISAACLYNGIIYVTLHNMLKISMPPEEWAKVQKVSIIPS